MQDEIMRNSAETPTRPHSATVGFNLLDYLIILLKRKRMIFAVTGSMIILAVAVSFILPKKYLGGTKILPPVQNSSTLAAQLVSQMGPAAGLLAGSLGGLQSTSDLYGAMITSRTVLDRVIERFRLKELYELDTLEDIREKMVEKVISVDVDKASGIITIGVLDKEPQRAADMANTLVEALKDLAKGMAISEAAQRRLFFEEQVKDTKLALTRVEDEMKRFQENTGALQVEDQAKAVIEGIANVRAQIAAKEVELRVMRAYATPQNPDLQKLEDELRGLKGEANKLEAKGAITYDPLMPTRRMPEVGLEYLRRMRDLKFNETLLELLTKQYEMAKMDEARDAAVIQIIDKAIPPDKEAKPNKELIIAVGAALGLFLSILFAFLAEYKERILYDPGTKERFEILRQHLRIRRRK